MFALRLLLIFIFVVSILATEELQERNIENVGNDSLEIDYAVPGEWGDKYDYYLDSYYDPLNVTLRKCFCDLDEIWNGISCEKSETSVPISNTYWNNLYYVNTSRFRNASIGEVLCPNRNILHEIERHSNFSHDVYLLEPDLLFPDIQLVLSLGVFENYCVEHIYNETMQHNLWFAQICLKPPTIPNCCPAGHGIVRDGSCVKSESNKFSPSVNLGGNDVWKLEVEGLYRNVSNCGDSEMMVIENIDSDVFLNYWYEENYPYQSYLVKNNIRFNTNFCVGMAEGIGQEQDYIAKFCLKDECRGKTCVSKCCNEYQYYSKLHGCVSYTNPEKQFFQPIFYDSYNLSLTSKPKDLAIKYGWPKCEIRLIMEPHLKKDHTFFLVKTGYLKWAGSPLVPPSKYCLESLYDDDDKSHMFAVVCYEETEKSICSNVQTYLYPILIVVSIAFLSVMFTVYLIFPELHAYVHGKCLLSHVFALLLAYVSLFITQRTNKSLPSFACKIMASLMHFSFLSSFFWLNVMYIDIWWTIKSLRPVPETGERSRLRFKLYSLYSWGCPLVIAIASAVIQSLPDDVNLVKPGFGDAVCWFHQKTPKWIYFYGIILVLIITNVILFCQVAYILLVQHDNKILKNQRTRQQNLKRAWLYVKLFVVMGITWLAEVISWHEEGCWAWLIFDIINSLQGVSIFFVYVYNNKKLINKICSKLEPYLRQVKEVVGSAKLLPSRTQTVENANTENRDKHSSSCIGNKRNESLASQTTFQNQISVDSASDRKYSINSSTNVLTGAEVHIQNTNPMETTTNSPQMETQPSPTSGFYLDAPVEISLHERNEESESIGKDDDVNVLKEDPGIINESYHTEEPLQTPPLDSTNQIVETCASEEEESNVGDAGDDCVIESENEKSTPEEKAVLE